LGDKKKKTTNIEQGGDQKMAVGWRGNENPIILVEKG